MANLGTKLARIDVLIGGADQARKKVEEMRKEWAELGKVIKEAEKSMVDAVDTVEYDKQKKIYTDALKRRKELQKSIQESERNMNTVEKYLKDISGQTLRNLGNARRDLNQMLQGVNPKNFKALETVRDYIKQVGDEIQRRKGNLIEFSDIMGNIGNVSDKSLGMAKQRLQELIAITEKNASEMQKYRDQLRQVEEEEQRRISSKAGRVMGNLDGSSVAEIQEAIKVTTQLRDAQKLGGQEWEIYNDEIQRAQKYLSDFKELGKQLAMSDRMEDLAKASTASLAELKKYWQEQVDGAQRGSQELVEYEKQLKKVTKEETKRTRERAINVVGNLDNSSVSEIQEAIKNIEQLRDATSRGSRQWDFYNENLKAAKNYLQEYAETDKRNDIVQRMQDIGNVSTSSLAELKKFWQEQVDGAELSSKSLQTYKQQLESVVKEERKRVEQRAKSTLGSIQGGTFNATIGETKEAIKLLEQYKQQLKVSDTEGIQKVDDAIKSLNERMKQASDSTMSLKKALDKAEEVGKNTFDGTIEDLDKLKKTLEDYKKKLKATDSQGLKKIQDALQNIEKQQKKVARETVNIDDTLRNLRTAPLEDLQKAAAKLQAELSEAERNTEEYIIASRRLRSVNAEIKEVKKSWEEHDNQIVATMKRLTSYVLVCAGFNEVVGRMKQLFQANLELSDSMADIQKTTGLTAEAVAELGTEIDKMDTRTAQQQLYELAASAGQAGLNSREDILGFVRAADQLTIALNELGNDGVNTLLKISNLTGDGKLLGTEKALLAIGSSINELSAASAATAGPITDIISRIGAVGSVAGLSMAEMAAFGATMDELGQSAEVSSTAFNIFLTALQSNTRKISMAIGVDDKEIERLMKSGQTMEAVFIVLEKLKALGEEDGLKVLGPLLKEFGSEGNRMNTIITSMAKNIDIFRARVDLSREAYEEMTSVTEEAMVKQDSAIGILNRLGNELKEAFVNSGVVEGIKSLLLVLNDFLQWLKASPNFVIFFTTAISGLTAAYIANTIAVKANLKELKATEAWVRTKAAILALGKALITAKTYTDLLTKSWVALKKAVSANWIALAAGALVAAGVAIYKYTTRVSEAAKASAEHAAALEKEKMRVDALFEGVKNLNDPLKDRKKLISEINAQYGEYLGFLISETDSTEKLAAAQKLVNAKIKERMTLQLKEKMEERAVEQYGGKKQDALISISGGFERAEGISDARASEARRLVQNIVDKNITLPINDILAAVKRELGKAFDTETGAYGSAAYFDIQSSLKDYINAQKDYKKALDVTLDEVNKEVEESDKDVIEANNDMLNAFTKDWNELKKIKTDSLDDKQLDEHYEKMKKVAEDYVNLASQQLKLVTGDQKKQLQEYVNFYENAISQIEKISKQKEPNIWGYGKTIDDASVDQLVAKYEQLFDERKTMRADADYTTAYAKEFKDRAEAMEWYLKKLKEIEKELNSRGYDTKGNFLKGGRGEDKRMREEIDAAMSALEAYFLRRQQAIRQAYIDEQITTEEMNRQIDQTEEEHLLARVELRKRLLGQESTFNKDLYGMSDKDLDKLAGFLKKLGDRETDGMQKKLEEDLLTMMNNIIKYRQEIEKELRKYNPFETLVYQFEESLDKLQLLNPEFEKIAREMLGMSGVISQDEIKRRTEALVNLSQESYNLTELELRGRLQAIDKLWGEGMSPEQMSLMLKKLRDFYQDSKAAAEKYAKDISQMMEVQWEASGKDKAWDDRIQNADDRAELMNAAGRLGLTSTESSFLGTSETDNAELEALRLRLEAAAEYYAQFESRKKEIMAQAMASGATQAQAEEAFLLAQKEAHDEYLSAREGQLAKELEITESKYQSIKGYTDAIVDFAGQMGEAAFGEVEDRKEAAKQLLQTAMQLTKDLIMQKVQELLMKKALNKQEEAQELASSNTISTIKGTSAITNLTVEGSETTAENALGLSKGAAKIIGQLGPWGIPLIAVISAALSALMGVAMSKLNKSKEEIASATGASSSKGRVAAGMLTYAKGDYPVLGNDGQIYNARYQKELKTGVYGGGAHFGIFSEKKPEMIVDGDTTQKLILNYPHIYDSILTIARHGQLKQAAMPTYATGNYPAQASGMNLQGQAVMTDMMSNAQMQETLVQLSVAVSSLTERLNKPISATMDPYQANKTLKKTDKFMNKRGLI